MFTFYMPYIYDTVGTCSTYKDKRAQDKYSYSYSSVLLNRLQNKRFALCKGSRLNVWTVSSSLISGRLNTDSMCLMQKSANRWAETQSVSITQPDGSNFWFNNNITNNKHRTLFNWGNNERQTHYRSLFTYLHKLCACKIVKTHKHS